MVLFLDCEYLNKMFNTVFHQPMNKVQSGEPRDNFWWAPTPNLDKWLRNASDKASFVLLIQFFQILFPETKIFKNKIAFFFTRFLWSKVFFSSVEVKNVEHIVKA